MCAEAAAEALILFAENGGPTMLARIGVMALNRGLVREFTDSGKKHHWGGGSSREINEDVLLHRVGWPDCMRDDGRHCHANEATD
jgi:hypothetical protein